MYQIIVLEFTSSYLFSLVDFEVISNILKYIKVKLEINFLTQNSRTFFLLDFQSSRLEGTEKIFALEKYLD